MDARLQRHLQGGITFDGWSTRPGFESYFHPFASMLDNLTMTQFVHNARARLNGADVDAHPDRFFIASRLADAHMAPMPDSNFPFDVWYGYHFDAVLLGQFLHGKALERGVKYQSCHVTPCNLDERGDIASLRPGGRDDRRRLLRRLHGFCVAADRQGAGHAVRQFPEQPLQRCRGRDADADGRSSSQTVSTAMGTAGRGRFPLTSATATATSTARVLHARRGRARTARALGLLDSDAPARHLKMRIGRVTQHWNRNCLAVGLSQGFIEPLEATALLFIQQTATAFVEALEEGDLGEAARERFNERVNDHFEARATTSSRTTRPTPGPTPSTGAPTPRTCTCRIAEGPAPLDGRQPHRRAVRQSIGQAYPVFSWYCILAGMGIFPDPQDLRPPSRREGSYHITEIDNLLTRSAAQLP